MRIWSDCAGAAATGTVSWDVPVCPLEPVHTAPRVNVPAAGGVQVADA